MTPTERLEFDMEWRRHYTWPMPMAAAVAKAESLVKVTMPEPARQALIDKGDALLKSDRHGEFLDAIRAYQKAGKSNLDALTEGCVDYGLVW